MKPAKAQIATRVDRELLEQIERIEKEVRADRSEVIRRLLDEGVKQYQTKKAIELLRDGKITVSRAAEIARVSIWDMLEIMHMKKIPIPYGAEDLREGLESMR